MISVGILLVVTPFIAAAVLLFLFSLIAQIGDGIQQALSSPEFQAQMAVMAVCYFMASWLITAWNHFESLFHDLDAMEQVSAASLNGLDDAISIFWG